MYESVVWEKEKKNLPVWFVSAQSCMSFVMLYPATIDLLSQDINFYFIWMDFRLSVFDRDLSSSLWLSRNALISLPM